MDTDCHVLEWFWKPQSRAFQRYQNHVNWPSGCWDIANSLLWTTAFGRVFCTFWWNRDSSDQIICTVVYCFWISMAWIKPSQNFLFWTNHVIVSVTKGSRNKSRTRFGCSNTNTPNLESLTWLMCIKYLKSRQQSPYMVYGGCTLSNQRLLQNVCL